MRLLVTGFGPFGDISDNPSSTLARGCGRPYELLDVSFRSVEEWLEGLDSSDFDGLLHIGVAASSSKMRLETRARNEIGASPDVRGEVWGPMPIDPQGTRQLSSTLWPAEMLAETEDWEPSVDAGTYLCNFLLFRSWQRFSRHRVGFLHVPTFEQMPQERQAEALESILARLEASET